MKKIQDFLSIMDSNFLSSGVYVYVGLRAMNSNSFIDLLDLCTRYLNFFAYLWLCIAPVSVHLFL